MLAGFYSRNRDGSIRSKEFVRSLTRSMACTVLLCLLCSGASHAQGSGQDVTGRPAGIDIATGTENGQVIGGYTVQQSVELGGRITEQNGNGGMYNTLVNLQSGPRLFEQTLLIRPMANTTSPYFDNIYVQSFGWGGDPSNALRVRVAKHGIYDFRASFRRDQNYFDYNLLANPLNPPATATVPFIPINISPHAMNMTRRMYDYSLILLPQKTVSFRVDYFRNRNEGPSFSSQHVGTEALLDQAYNTTNDTLRLGLSWRVTQRTTLSYIQSLQWLKNDTDFTLSTALPAIVFSTSTGVPVNYGVSWGGGSPCATPLIGGFANPVCSGYLAYTRTQQYRSYLPSEQVTLSSRESRRVDLNARYMYSNADAFTPYGEIFNGLDSRAAVRAYNNAGSAAHSTWVVNEADAGVTIRLASNLRFVDTFRFYAHRIPGSLYFFQSNFFGTTAANILQPIAVPPATPFHTTSSPADIVNQFYHRFVQQRLLSNLAELQYDFSHSFGVRAGFQYRDIQDNHDWFTNAVANTYLPGGPSIATCLSNGGVLNANGTCTVTGLLDSEFEHFPNISQYWGIVGAWYRMADLFHLDAEARYMTANDFFVRIDPRREQQYRAIASYTPRSWVTIGANMNLREQRNNSPLTSPTLASTIAYNAHNRNFGVNVLAAKGKRVAVEAAYNFTNTGQNSNVCFAGGIAPGTCVGDTTGALTQALGFYWNKTNYGSANVMVRPIPRVSILAGFSIIDTDGNTLLTNPRSPLGSLSSRYYEPLASLSIGITKQVEFRGGWNYYQYNDANSATAGSAILSRYFQANLVNLSLRYAF